MHRFRYIYLFLRWLLQVDLPADRRSDEDVAAEVERNFNWNFVVNVLDGAPSPAGPITTVSAPAAASKAESIQGVWPTSRAWWPSLSSTAWHNDCD